MEVPINKDIRKYKVREVGVFTIREALGMVLMAAGCYIAYGIQMNTIGTVIMPFMFLGAAPGICIGFVHYHGIPFEKFVKTVVIENVFNPRIRPYETETNYDLSDFMTKEELEEYIKETTPNNKVKIPDELKSELTGYK